MRDETERESDRVGKRVRESEREEEWVALKRDLISTSSNFVEYCSTIKYTNCVVMPQVCEIC